MASQMSECAAFTSSSMPDVSVGIRIPDGSAE
jgi:hypothetical protein